MVEVALEQPSQCYMWVWDNSIQLLKKNHYDHVTWAHFCPSNFEFVVNNLMVEKKATTERMFLLIPAQKKKKIVPNFNF